MPGGPLQSVEERRREAHALQYALAARKARANEIGGRPRSDTEMDASALSWTELRQGGVQLSLAATPPPGLAGKSPLESLVMRPIERPPPVSSRQRPSTVSGSVEDWPSPRLKQRSGAASARLSQSGATSSRDRAIDTHLIYRMHDLFSPRGWLHSASSGRAFGQGIGKLAFPPDQGAAVNKSHESATRNGQEGGVLPTASAIVQHGASACSSVLQPSACVGSGACREADASRGRRADRRADAGRPLRNLRPHTIMVYSSRLPGDRTNPVRIADATSRVNPMAQALDRSRPVTAGGVPADRLPTLPRSWRSELAPSSAPPGDRRVPTPHSGGPCDTSCSNATDYAPAASDAAAPAACSASIASMATSAVPPRSARPARGVRANAARRANVGHGRSNPSTGRSVGNSAGCSLSARDSSINRLSGTSLSDHLFEQSSLGYGESDSDVVASFSRSGRLLSAVRNQDPSVLLRDLLEGHEG